MTDLRDLPTRDLARMIAPYFDDFRDHADFLDYLSLTRDADLSLRDNLIRALDLDLSDLLHNANLIDCLPPAADLSDDDHDALMLRILDADDILDIIADHIIARHPDWK